MSKKVYKIISNQGHEIIIDDSDIGRVMTESSGMLLIANKDNDIIFASPPGGWSHIYRTDEEPSIAQASTHVAQYDPNVQSSFAGTVTAVDDDGAVEIETGVEAGSYLDKAYGEALSAVIESLQGMLDDRMAGLETAVREGDLYEVVPMSLKEYAILELRNLADLIETGGVRLLDMGVSSPDISEAIEDGYVVASAGNRWVMNVSYWMKRE